ncbi:uromodulin-like 1 [Lethenteron reissneri]|uniref:uromodulin-like 1 n=1 Tax=Lethenteron reissneri TaxID=7753 RepID=UPI002AB71C71|nr:uromodulin-like 1 [Lethenteron reissneri]
MWSSVPSPLGPSSSDDVNPTFGSSVSVGCDDLRLWAALPLPALLRANFPWDSLFIGTPECTARFANSTHVTLHLLLSKHVNPGACGADVTTQNTTHTLMRSEIHDQDKKLKLQLYCLLPNVLNITTGFIPIGFVINDTAHGTGQYEVSVRLSHSGDGGHSVGLAPMLHESEQLDVELALANAAPPLRLIIESCWATRTNSSHEPRARLLIINRCPTAAETLTITENGSSSRAGFRVRVFRLLEETASLFIHCQLRVCVEAECDTDCSRANSARLLRWDRWDRRSSAATAVHNVVTLGPVQRVKRDSPSHAHAGDGTEAAMSAVLGGLLGFSLLVLLVTLLTVKRCDAHAFAFRPGPGAGPPSAELARPVDPAQWSLHSC